MVLTRCAAYIDGGPCAFVTADAQGGSNKPAVARQLADVVRFAGEIKRDHLAGLGVDTLAELLIHREAASIDG